MLGSFRKSMTVLSLLVVATMVIAACGAAVTVNTPGASTATPGTLPQTGSTATAPVTSTMTTTVPTTSTTPTAAATSPVTSTAPTTPTATTGSAGGPTYPSTAAKNPGTLVEATIGDPSTLDPNWAYDTASGEVIQNVYETLLFPKREAATQFVPMLATKWTISPDGKTYTFTIRQGVKFHQGQTLTPEDVAYSFWRGMIQDRAGGPQWIFLQPFFGLNVGTFADDVVKKQFNGDWTKAAQAVEQKVTFDNAAGTVTMHLAQPFGPFLQALTGTWGSILSKQWVVAQGGWDGSPATAQKFHDPTAEKDELFNKMNGTGPYMFQQWLPNQEVDLQANPNYWVKTPLWPGGPSGVAKVQRVAIKNVSEFGTRFAMLKTGDADIAYVDNQYISQVDPLVAQTCDVTGKCSAASSSSQTLRLWKGLPTVQEDVIYFTQQVNTTGGNQNLGSGKLDGNGVPANFFSDINIRKAFNYCFDWNTYIKQIWNGEAIQGLGPIIQGELGYQASQAKYSFDLNQCAASFKASTLKSASGQSVWDTGFTLNYVYNTGNDQRRVAGEILKNSLQQVNPKFKLNVVEEPFAAELKDQVAGRLPIFMLGWVEDYHDPNDWVGPFMQSTGAYAASQGFDKTVQAQFDKLITQAVSSTDQNQRAQLYAQLQNLAYQNAIDIWVVQPLGRHYEQMWVKGYYYNPTYNGQYFYALSK